MTTIDKSQHPMYEAREHGGTWDIVMRIPHVSGHGATVEQIIIIAENCGVAPEEATIARRVEALLNMSAHIDTEDLFIKGATLKLQTFSERMAAQSGCEVVRPAIDPDSEQDLRDTCDSMRRALNRLGKRFGMTSSHPDMVVNNAIECADKNEASARQVAETLADRTTRLDKATSQLEHIEKLLIEHEHHTEGAALWASVDKLIDRVQVLEDEDGSNLVNVSRALDEAREANKETAGQLAKADQELAQARGERDEAHRALKEIQRVLGVTVEHPKELPALITKLANDLTSVRSSQTTLDPFKREVMALCMITPSTPDMLPSLPELLVGIRDYVNTLTRYRGGAMILHDLACQLVDREHLATDAEPYAHHPWDVLAEHLKAEFNGPRNAIIAMADNFELERDGEHYSDAVAAIYHYIKGLSVAQYKNDQQLQTLLRERNADRAIIGAIDDLCSDKLNRPPVPVLAAVRALVRSHLIATERD